MSAKAKAEPAAADPANGEEDDRDPQQCELAGFLLLEVDLPEDDAEPREMRSCAIEERAVGAHDEDQVAHLANRRRAV